MLVGITRKIEIDMIEVWVLVGSNDCISHTTDSLFGGVINKNEPTSSHQASGGALEVECRKSIDKGRVGDVAKGTRQGTHNQW